MQPGLGYAVLAAVVLGAYLSFFKRYLSHHSTPVYVIVSNVFGLVWVLPATLWWSEALLPGSFDLAAAGVMVGVIGCTAVALLAFVRALVVGDVSYVAPISKVVPAFVLPIEVVALGQHLTLLQVAGVVVATVAVYVANYRPGELFEPLRRALASRPARLALASAIAFAFVDVGKRVVMQELSIPVLTWVPLMLAGVTLLMLPLARGRWDLAAVRADLSLFVLAGAVVGFGEVLVSLTFQTLPASVASPIVNTQAVVAVLLGGLLLNEPHFRVRLLAAGLAVAGVLLLAIG